jgi:hypothetical protein
VQTGNGLGREDISLLTEGQIVAYQKVSIALIFMINMCLTTAQGDYANKLLYIATLAFAKLSIISLLMILTASNLHRKLGWILTGLIALWGILSEFVSAFQCGANEPWRFLGMNDQCLDLVSLLRCRGVAGGSLTRYRYLFGVAWALSIY